MSPVINVLRFMEENNVSVLSLVTVLLHEKSVTQEFKRIRQSLVNEARNVCAHLYQCLATQGEVFSWAFGLVKETLMQELQELAHKRHGLHFKATTVTSEQLEGSLVNDIAQKITKVAPYLWGFVSSLLLSPSRRRAGFRDMDTNGIAFRDELEEGDLGDIGGDTMDVDEPEAEETENDEEVDSEVRECDGTAQRHGRSDRKSKRSQRAAERNRALLKIVSDLT
ncbi:hypothetical protein BJ138DRAFT_1001819 [Hygrophoropsis aurantiaca]|uniref:Uncharacterized protein n=1 Tax=Hygrophoropsis aurantiaca TaxID=72124 RepID=A0ACB8AJX2_9AGAM|nr:hypothetical protein BJ138DRAFT_1001819 [Hygrophoropsis aurantiaca]